MNLTKFWVDYYIPIQEQNKEFPIANVVDVASSLIKSRNWLGTIVEELIKISQDVSEKKKELNVINKLQNNLENKILIEADIKLTGIMMKNRDTIRLYAKKFASQTQLDVLEEYDDQQAGLQVALTSLLSEKEDLEKILKIIEKAAEWSIQYINWQKFELRTLNE